MLNLRTSFEHTTDPFTVHLAQGLLDPAQARRLYDARPSGSKRIVRAEASHEKQYAMNLLYLMEDGQRNAEAGLGPEWEALVDNLTSTAFLDWLEAGTDLRLRHLVTDIGMYAHDDGDFISIHKDKPNKALTAILYVNEHWPADAGGHFVVHRTSDPHEAPVRTIPPRAGQFLAFPPTDSSWHAVSPVTTHGTLTRLTVQLEFWHNKDR